jgi:hypothetical protein
MKQTTGLARILGIGVISALSFFGIESRVNAGEGYGQILGKTLQAQSGYNPSVVMFTESVTMAQEREDQLNNAATKAAASRDLEAINKAKEELQEERLRLIRVQNELKNAEETKTKMQKRDPYNLRKKLAFTCNSRADLNNNGGIDLTEFQGVKNTFYENEPIMLYVTGFENKKMKPVLYNPQGKIVYTREETPKSSIWISLDGEELETILKQSGIGSYKAVVYIDDKLEATHEFEILPRPKN